MTLSPTSPNPEEPAARPVRRRGRPPEAIEPQIGPTHRAWLEPVRTRLFASGLTLDELVGRSGYSKTRISELLRGKGYYPGWAITYSVVRALDIPVRPMRRLWTSAAHEAHKSSGWIENRVDDARPPDSEIPPVAHRGFTEAMAHPYTAYAHAFLQSEQRARTTVGEVFDILWLTWDQAVAAPDTRRHAWHLLRARVLHRAHRRPDGRPDLRAAAFATEAQARIHDLGERFAHIERFTRFFDAVAALPEDQRDVVVLRYLCGIDQHAVPGVLGLSPAITHTLDHHARGALELQGPHLDEPGATTP
ncbi:XRE family transcriptional regulator [Streptomyces niveiscabiei]|uniref:XRE family transcriptional regulator n=1 Tax=Streptomyces niveiscabiei TaxID=164115 RepID=UPI0029A0C6A0|nr:XRE family transcriptional regulator [Streptomyces niveiscabiei]MDX3384708.1 XRE family transcriptional regulator [Streptomyces niveiscabiei]